MNEDRKGKAGGDALNVERELGRLPAAPVPAGLRQRVLERAEEARRGAVLTPGFRRLAVACLAAIVAVLVFGPLIGRREAARLAAALDGRPSVPRAESPAPELSELLAGDEGGANRLARLQALATSVVRADRPAHFIQARERLKGWLNNEASEGPD